MAKTFRYPLKNIDASDDYFLIESYDYVPPGLNLGDTGSFAQKSSDDVGYGSKSSRGTVILPIPENIQDSNSASWGEGNMGPIETATMGAAMGIIGGPEPLKAGVEALKSVFNKLGAASKTAIGQDLSQTFFASKAAEALTGNGDFNQALSRETGAVFNSNTELLFNGVSLRPGFSFSFDMVPRSRTESDQIKDIIRFFKSESAAQKGAAAGDASGLFLKSPSVFRLRYMSGGRSHPFLNQFKICALNAMSVNYTASGTYATYSDATPVHMQMTLTFQELTPIYREDYIEAGSSTGAYKSTITGTGF
tara:strand:+ start:55 stop:975 length:921 start_codon:yes stop_codon:yes gene_type:complete